MKPLVVMPLARMNLDEIRAYSTRQWGLANWEKRAWLFKEAFDAISENPSGGQDRGNLVPAMRSKLINPHVVFFIERDDAVALLRVVDGRRDLPNLDYAVR